MTSTTRIEPQKNQTVGLTVNIETLIKLLGSSNYASKIVDLTLKELVQNSVDAIRSAYKANVLLQGDGQIDIRINTEKRILSVSDNGHGMKSETVKDIFLSIGGSEKSNLNHRESSGGFGLAKLVFLFAGDKIIVKSIHNGTITVIKGRTNDLIYNRAQMLTNKTSLSNGTNIRVQYPNMTTHENNNEKEIFFPTTLESIPFLQTPLLENITLTFQVNNEAPFTIENGKLFNHSRFNHTANIKTRWGTIKTYRLKNGYRTGVPQKFVLSSGVFQFRGFYPQLTETTIIDVKSDVAPTDHFYPFDKRREGWAPSVNVENEALIQIFKFQETQYERVKLLSDFQNGFKIIKSGQGINEKFYFSPLSKVQPNQSCLSKEKPTTFHIKADGIYLNNDILFAYEKQKFIATSSFHKLCQQSSYKPDCTYPHFYSQLDFDLIKKTSQIASCSPQIVQNTFGALAYYANDIVKNIAALPSFKPLIKGPFVCGLLLSTKTAGYKINSPFNGLFINPIPHKGTTPTAWAFGWLDTIIHESAHWKGMSHDDNFAINISNIRSELEENRPGSYFSSFEKIEKLAGKHMKIFQAAKQTVDKTLG